MKVRRLIDALSFLNLLKITTNDAYNQVNMEMVRKRSRFKKAKREYDDLSKSLANSKFASVDYSPKQLKCIKKFIIDNSPEIAQFLESIKDKRFFLKAFRESFHRTLILKHTIAEKVAELMSQKHITSKGILMEFNAEIKRLKNCNPIAIGEDVCQVFDRLNIPNITIGIFLWFSIEFCFVSESKNIINLVRQIRTEENMQFFKSWDLIFKSDSIEDIEDHLKCMAEFMKKDINDIEEMANNFNHQDLFESVKKIAKMQYSMFLCIRIAHSKNPEALMAFRKLVRQAIESDDIFTSNIIIAIANWYLKTHCNTSLLQVLETIVNSFKIN